LSDVFHTRFGFHIALVEDHKPEGIRSFDEIRPEIELALLRERQDRELGAQLTELRRRAVIRKAPLAS
jgi:parvulin-like peptidyl-prolyl isomerase